MFVLKSAGHERFSRSGPNLVHKATIPLYFGLVGSTVEIDMLDSRQVLEQLYPIIQPSYVQTFHIVEGSNFAEKNISVDREKNYCL